MKKIEALLFVAGSLLFGTLLYFFGWEKLLANLQHTGRWFTMIFALYLPVYALNNQTWRLLLGAERRQFAWLETFRFTVSAFALNYVTPVIALGGEAYRAYALTPKLDARTATSTVVLFRLLHTLAHVISWLLALLMAFAFMPHSPWWVAAASVTGAVLIGLLILLFFAPANGFVGKSINVMPGWRFLSPIKNFIQTKRQALEQVNAVIVHFYCKHRSALFAGIALEFAARAISYMEIYIILQSLGITTAPWLSFYIYATASLFTNIIFFVPFELGVKEGGLYFILSSLGLTPGLGVFIGVVSRIREFFWIFIGLIFLLIKRQHRWATGKIPAS